MTDFNAVARAAGLASPRDFFTGNLGHEPRWLYDTYAFLGTEDATDNIDFFVLPAGYEVKAMWIHFTDLGGTVDGFFELVNLKGSAVAGSLDRITGTVTLSGTATDSIQALVTGATKADAKAKDTLVRYNIATSTTPAAGTFNVMCLALPVNIGGGTAI